MDAESVRERVRALIAAGTLPCEPEDRVWAGRGTGDTCAACVQPIDRTEIEFEVDLPSGRTLRLHRQCHRIWLEECEPEIDAGASPHR